MLVGMIIVANITFFRLVEDNFNIMNQVFCTGVVGVPFVVTLFASAANYIWEEGIRRDAVMNAVVYGIVLVVITGIGMTTVEKITTSYQTVRVAASVDIIKERAKQTVQNEAALLVFPEDAFVCPESSSQRYSQREQNQHIAYPSQFSRKM